MTKLKKGLAYDDVLLVPQYSDIVSRKEVDISRQLKVGTQNYSFEIPIISSPMDTITESRMAISMANAGGLGIVHRYNSIEEQANIVAMIKKTCPTAPVSAAIGVSGDYIDRAGALVEAGASILCVDIAHGHHIMMKEALRSLRYCLPKIHLMAGNVATREGFEDLAEWGADSIRCNIGGGSICSTRTQTGHGVPGLQTIIDCFLANTTRDVKIIADGGIKNSGDIVKALAAGADFVMLGSLLSGTIQAPGEIITDKTGTLYKTYRGMASPEAQKDWRGKASSLEGVSAVVQFKGDVAEVLEDLCTGIRSGLSYSGARTIEELQARAEFIQQTSAGSVESGTHILGSK